MWKQFINKYVASIVFLIFTTAACRDNGGLYISSQNRLAGYVLGNETCDSPASQDYWLVDFTYGGNNLQVGDTIILNGKQYTNVLKTLDLDPAFKQPGIKIWIESSKISDRPVATTGCSVSSPVVYAVKVVNISTQARFE